MAVDVRRVIQAAVEAALEEPPPRKKHRLTGGKALLLGAGLMTAGKLAVGPRGRDALDSLRQRVGELAGIDEDADGVPDDEDLEEELDDEEEPPSEPQVQPRSTRGR
jgi:hypothetical protein